MPLALDHGEVPDAAQQRIGYSRRTARAQCDLRRGIVVDRYVDYMRRPLHDTGQHRRIIILQMALNAETRPKRRGQKAATGRGADQRKRRQFDLYRTCGGALVENDIDLVILHGRVEILLHYRTETMYFVDEQHVARRKVGQQAGQIARLVEHRARSDFQLRPHFVGDDVGQRRLAQSRRSVQQHVVERVAAHKCGLDEYSEIVDDLILSGKARKRLRPYAVLELPVALYVPHVPVGTHKSTADLQLQI